MLAPQEEVNGRTCWTYSYLGPDTNPTADREGRDQCVDWHQDFYKKTNTRKYVFKKKKKDKEEERENMFTSHTMQKSFYKYSSEYKSVFN